ncbi:MAG: hypothetical protein NT080_13935 [Spirochaetes bacterium]|nr:hypothetical protein [Spirochaetota bacterium]
MPRSPKSGFILLISLFLVFSCRSSPAPVQPEPASSGAHPPAATVQPVGPEISEERQPFTPELISQDEKRNTLVDVEKFIEELNQVIQRKEFETWLTYLTPEYIEYYSSPETLAEWSNFPVLKRQGIMLKTLKDFFFYIVYPSRGSAKPDDIEYLDYMLIKVMAINSKGERVVLYYLEKVGNSWKMTVRR